MSQNVGADFSATATHRSKEGAWRRLIGRLIAWDPVNQKEVWRVERAGPGQWRRAVGRPADWCSRARARALFTALDAASGKELWSTGTQTGVVAAPITYEIDGEQYVAIMAGTGSSWALISVAART